MFKRLITILLALSAGISATPVHSVELLDAGRPILSDGKEFVGPYTLSIDGHDVPALCIDFSHHMQIGRRWEAYVINLSSSLEHSLHPSQFAVYEAEAYLFDLLLDGNADRIEIQHAAWALTDTGYSATPAELCWVEQAEAKAASIADSSYSLVSSLSQGSNGEQEFIIRTLPSPEPPTRLLALAAAILAIALWLRNRPD